MPVINTIQVRRGTAAAWTSANPTLAAGEPGFETDTGKIKIGDGTTAWTSLAYRFGGAVASDTIWDTKGDILVASGADAADNLAVGTNGQVLTADSAETLGVKWATPTGGSVSLEDVELDYVQTTSSVTISASSGSPQTVLTGASLSYDGSTRVAIEVWASSIDDVNSAMVVELYEDSTLLGRIVTTGGDADSTPLIGKFYRTPSSGTHQYFVKAWKNGGTNGTISAGASVPMFMRVSKATTSMTIPTIVTSLPGSPSDGDEIYYKAGSGDSAVLWHLKYDSSITDSYKWRYLGGAPMAHEVDTDQTIGTAGSWVDLTTVGPTITIPLAGIYEAIGRVSSYSTTLTTCRAGIKVGATDPTNDTGAESSAGNVADSRDLYDPSVTVTAASTVVKMVYQAGNTTAHFRYRRLSLKPIRVG